MQFNWNSTNMRRYITYITYLLRKGRLQEVVRAREPASFWRENAIAVDNLLLVLAKMSKWRKQVDKCEKFYQSAIGRGFSLLQ